MTVAIENSKIQGINPNVRSGDIQKERIIAIDFLKGISISLVIFAHLAVYVLRADSVWFYHILLLFLDVFGPSIFIFLSCLGVIFSVKSKKSKDINEIKRNILKRALGLLMIGFIYNLILNFSRFGFMGLFAWGVFQFIAIGQIFTFYILKIERHKRLFLAIFILLITPTIFNHLTGIMFDLGIDFKTLRFGDLIHPAAFAFWLLFYPAQQVPFIPWIVIVIIGSITGEDLVDAYTSGDVNKYKKFYKSILVDGVLLIIFGILTGFSLHSEDYGLNILQGINSAPFFNWSGIPEFLVHSSVPNILYSVGVALVLLGWVIYIYEIKKHSNKIVKAMVFLGKVSLSLYLLQPLYLLGTHQSMGIGAILAYTVFCIISLGVMLYFWKNKLRSIGTVEWLVGKIGSLFIRTRKSTQVSSN